MRRYLTIRLNRWWRAFLVALAAYAILGVVVLVTAPDLAGVFLLGAYCIPSNSIIPIPHEPGVLFFAKYYAPVWIAIAATAGSVIASFADYALVDAARNHRFFAGTRGSRLFRWSIRAMRRFPFAIIVLFSFTPLPISVVRILAPAAQYPIARYIAAQVVGRFPRFFVLALLGRAVMIPTWVLVALFGVLLLAIWLGGRSKPADEDGEKVLVSEAG